MCASVFNGQNKPRQYLCLNYHAHMYARSNFCRIRESLFKVLWGSWRFCRVLQGSAKYTYSAIQFDNLTKCTVVLWRPFFLSRMRIIRKELGSGFLYRHRSKGCFLRVSMCAGTRCPMSAHAQFCFLANISLFSLYTNVKATLQVFL